MQVYIRPSELVFVVRCFVSVKMAKLGIRQVMLIGLMLLLSGTIVKGDDSDIKVNSINDSEEGILLTSEDGKSRVCEKNLE